MTKRNHTKNGGGGTGNGKTQTFSFTAHEATSVQLVGDFTRWQQAPVSLRKGADGLWQAAVAMPPGEHHYRFIVDGLEFRCFRFCQTHAVVNNPSAARPLGKVHAYDREIQL